MFNIGDRVLSLTYPYQGFVGEVVGIHAGLDEKYYQVRFGKVEVFYYKESELVRVAENKKQVGLIARKE